MWGAIGALLTRAGAALGIELPDVTAVGDAANAAVDGQAGEVSAGVTGIATDLTARVAGAGDTVTSAVDQAAATVPGRLSPGDR